MNKDIVFIIGNLLFMFACVLGLVSAFAMSWTILYISAILGFSGIIIIYFGLNMPYEKPCS